MRAYASGGVKGRKSGPSWMMFLQTTYLPTYLEVINSDDGKLSGMILVIGRSHT
jgi:hypothetical protein